MKVNGILIIGGLAVGYYLFQKTRGISLLDYQNAGLQISKVGISNTTFDYKIKFLNPGLLNVKIDKVFLKIYSGSNLLGYIDATNPGTIAQQSSQVLSFPVNVSNIQMLKYAADIVKNNKLTGVKLEGTITANGITSNYTQVTDAQALPDVLGKLIGLFSKK